MKIFQGQDQDFSQKHKKMSRPRLA